MTGPTYDAVVVVAGPNGLVAANHLVDAGWSVLVLEAQPDVGGAVRSAQDVHPGFVHDTSAPSIPWPRHQRPFAPFTSRTTGWSGPTRPRCSAIGSDAREGRLRLLGCQRLRWRIGGAPQRGAD